MVSKCPAYKWGATARLLAPGKILKISLKRELGQWLRSKGVFPSVNTFIIGVQKAQSSHYMDLLLKQ